MMGKTKEIPVDLRQSIMNIRKSWNSYGTISNRLANPRSTVQSVIKKFQQFGLTENLTGAWKKSQIFSEDCTKCVSLG